MEKLDRLPHLKDMHVFGLSRKYQNYSLQMNYSYKITAYEFAHLELKTTGNQLER